MVTAFPHGPGRSVVYQMAKINPEVKMALAAGLNALIILGYILTWKAALNAGIMPENWTWGEFQGNHGPWRQWGFRDVYPAFLVIPIIAAILSLIDFEKQRILRGANAALSAILVFVAFNHYWLID